MKTFKPILALLLGVLISAPLSGQDKDDKIGTVDMKLLLKEYYKTNDLVEVFSGYEKGILAKNEIRIETIKALIKESQEFGKQAENPDLSREKQDKLFTKQRSLNQEAQAVQNERIAWMKRKRAAFSEKQTIELGILRREIMTMVQEIGVVQGYDLIFDRSGASGANVPILSYAKDATDLTLVLLERINRDAPPEDDDEGAGEEDPTTDAPPTDKPAE